MSDNTLKILTYITLAISCIWILIFFIWLKVKFSYLYMMLKLKDFAHSAFLSRKLAINNCVFDIYKKNYKNLLFYLLLLFGINIPIMALSFTMFVFNAILLSNDLDNKFMILFLIGFFILCIPFAIFVFFIIILSSIAKINKSIKYWKHLNATFTNSFDSLIENQDIKFNNELYVRIFNSSDLIFEITREMRGFDKSVFFKIKNWKNIFNKIKNIKFDELLYYFLIFDIDQTRLNGKYYSIEELAFIYKNRNSLVTLLNQNFRINQ